MRQDYEFTVTRTLKGFSVFIYRRGKAAVKNGLNRLSLAGADADEFVARQQKCHNDIESFAVCEEYFAEHLKKTNQK